MTAYYMPLLRKYYKNKNKKQSISQAQLRKICGKFFNSENIRDDLLTLFLGYIRKRIQRADQIIAERWDHTVSWDQMVEALPTVFAPLTKCMVYNV